MVEGPKVWLKCERMKVLEALQLLTYAMTKRGDEALMPQDVVMNEQLQSVRCVGKELFLLFTNNKMMRFHFGMNGSERIINAGSPPPELPAYSRKAITCILYFDLKTLHLYDTTVSVSTYNSTQFTAALETKLSRDVISPTFDLDTVLQLLTSDPRPIMDGILDQNIMPGVGNVIKCEGLFLSHLSPNQIAANISVSRLSELVNHLKDFSWRWYDSSKRNRGDIYKAVYGRSLCTVCQGVVTLVRSGQTHRITYYCNNCQPMIVVQQSAHAHSQFLHTIEALDENILPWECGACSGHNVSTATFCAICEGPAPVMPVTKTTAPLIPISNNDCAAIKQEPQQSTIQPLRCKCSQPATLNRVRKSGLTQHRLFWSCTQKSSSSKTKKKCGCDFFHWADLRFPKCSQHHARQEGYTIMRRVLKAGPNNGKYFFACSTDKCPFFVWESEFAKTLKSPNADNVTEAGSTSFLIGNKRLFDEAFGQNQFVHVPL